MLLGRSCFVLVLAILAVPVFAGAQPFEPPPPPAQGDVPPETMEPPPQPPPPPPPSPVPPPVEQEAPPPVEEEPDSDEPERPEGFSVGIGAGWDLPTDLSLPDTATVRFRLASGLTLEPFVVFGVSGSSVDFTDGDSTSDSASEVGLGTNVRIPVVGHGPVDLLIVAGARFDLASSNPDGDDNESSTVGTSLLWGLGLEYWLSRHGVISLTATNPLVSYLSTTEAQFDGEEVTQSSWSAGAIFRPDVMLLAHLFL